MERRFAEVVTYNHKKTTLPTPVLGDRSDERIKTIVPVEVIGGKCIDLRTGKEVSTGEGKAVWTAFPGDVFKYPDGKMIRINRKIATREVFLETIRYAGSAVVKTAMC